MTEDFYQRRIRRNMQACDRYWDDIRDGTDSDAPRLHSQAEYGESRLDTQLFLEELRKFDKASREKVIFAR